MNCFSFSCNMVFMMIWWRFSHTQSFGFISFQNTRKSCFNVIGCTTPTILLHNFAGQSRSHRCFQILTNILDGFFEFLILRVNEIDPLQFSCALQMEFFIRPLLLLLQLAIFPIVFQISGHKRSGLDVCSILVNLLPRPHVSIWRFFFQ